MAAAEEAWKARFRERVVQIDLRCGHVVARLAAALPHLASPMHELEGNAVAACGRIQHLQEVLGQATIDLGFILSYTAAVDMLARLLGGSTAPALPSPSVDQDRAAPVHVGDAVSASSRIQHSHDALTQAASDVVSVLATIGVDDVLARLHGQSTDPEVPLPSFDHLGDQGIRMRDAAIKLKTARVSAQEALNDLNSCLDILGMIDVLMDHPYLPSTDDCIDDERLDAVDYHELAMERAEECAALAAAARQDVAGGDN